MTIETRHTAGAVQLRKAEDGTVRMGGYALKFNRLSQNLGGFVERRQGHRLLAIRGERDLAALAERGDVQHSSFAFRTIADEWGFTEQGFPLRTLLEIQLVDVAPVVNPAYLDTTSGLRTLAEARHLDEATVLAAAREERLAEIIAPPVEPNDKRDIGPGETHPLIALRQRQAAFAQRRTPR